MSVEQEDPVTTSRRASRSVIWITNIAAPYRAPVWEHIAGSTNLTVALLESDHQRAREGRRGADWSPERLRGVRHRTLRTLKLRRGETSLYCLLDVRLLLGAKPHAVLLGGWESPAYWQVLLLAKFRRVRSVGFYESTLDTNRHRKGPIARARSWYMRRLDAIVVPGVAAEAAVRSFGVPPDRIHRGFNAVDVEHIAAKAATHPSRGTTARPGHQFVFVGQLIERKQCSLLVEAFESMRDADDRLLIVGEGPLLAALEARVAAAGLATAVTFAGHLDYERTIDAIISSNTLVMPSSEEVWGLVVNEGLAAGLHAVVSSRSGVASSVESMAGVFTCAPTKDALVRAMRASRESYNGPVRSPEVLKHTPRAFGEVFLGALFPSYRRADLTPIEQHSA